MTKLLYESPKHKLYLKLNEDRKDLIERLEKLVGEDKELTPAEEKMYDEIINLLSTVNQHSDDIFNELMAETDAMLLSQSS